MSINKNGTDWTVTVKITNTGTIAGKEVAQVYINAAKGNLKKPTSELKAFNKTELLSPGQSEIVTMTFKHSELASFHEDKSEWIVDAGDYTTLIGSSVADIHQTIFFSVTKALITKVNNMLKVNVEFERMK